MPASLLKHIRERHDLSLVDEEEIDAFLAPTPGRAPHSILFFAGDPAERCNLAQQRPALCKIYRDRLAAWANFQRKYLDTLAAGATGRRPARPGTDKEVAAARNSD